MYYVGFSRVIIIERFYIIEFCEDKIIVSLEVEKYMKYFRIEGKFELCILFVYNVDERVIKVCFLNVRFLYKFREVVNFRNKTKIKNRKFFFN